MTAPPARPSDSPAPGPADPEPVRSTGGAVLVVDDEPLLRTTLAFFLEELGQRVVAAADAAEAMAQLEEAAGGVGVLVTDVTLPGTDGVELARQACASHPGLRVVFMTAHSPERLAREGRLPPGVPILEKPFSPDRLREAIRAVLAD